MKEKTILVFSKLVFYEGINRSKEESAMDEKKKDRWNNMDEMEDSDDSLVFYSEDSLKGRIHGAFESYVFNMTETNFKIKNLNLIKKKVTQPPPTNTL